MTESCFFDKRKKCIVLERMLNDENTKALTIPKINQPLKDWCPSCLLWQLLQEMKK